MILQRASAGSGKTFRLAKTYIRLFIAARHNPGGRYCLRLPGALREKHSRILGVTFTNKATNEMKERIVGKLAALAIPHPEPGFEPQGWHAPDYLLDFTGENPDACSQEDDLIYENDGSRPASRASISRICAEALRVLLNDYGRFNISTIDTFFQNVLRAFAYELRLNDNYHVELNDSYLAQIGVDTTLSSINSRPGKGAAGRSRREMADYVTAWARSTIGEQIRRGESWNMFSKSNSSQIYSQLLNMAEKQSKESFRLKASLLKDYFSDISRFTRFVEACLKASGEVRSLFSQAVSRRAELRKLVAEAAGGDDNPCYSGMKTAWANIDALKPFSTLSPSKLGKKLEPYFCADPPEFNSANHFLLKSMPWRDDPSITGKFRVLGRDLFIWQRQRSYWQTVLSRLNFLGMLHYVEKCTEEFRTENNLIPLSATNEILRRIINGSDVPFIYERIGTRLHHFLLDEFQDTSEMQWTNLIPLLQQSIGYGAESLVIGDAKQSIYRFRNAEPDIISHRVAATFPTTRILPSPDAPLQEKAKVNANWRSSGLIVRANNTIFSLLTPLADDADDPFLLPLYADCVQEVRKKDLPGYIDISFSNPLGHNLINDDAGSIYDGLGPLIDDIRSRGYALSDIAILVNTNSEGSSAISALMNYNALHGREQDYAPIEILSEESLKVDDSAAVKVILAVLGAIARGFTPDEEQKEAEAMRSQVKLYELTRFIANFHCYFASHRSEPLDEILKKELDEMLPPELIRELLAEAPSTALPALVESIAARFTSMLGGEQAAYIAAFQDAVLEYCENYPADIASFLTWWDENGKSRCISAPEGIDAVRVMTIHKSKGLEFKVVLMPKADWYPGPTKDTCARELIWVSHTPQGLEELDAADMPPIFPVTPSLDMADPGSPFHEPYKIYERERIIDQMNKTYVAFTRAISELHIYAPVHKDRKKASSLYIGDYLDTALSRAGMDSLADPELMLTAAEIDYAPGSHFIAGTPTRAEKRIDRHEAGLEDVIVIDSYSNSGPPPALLSVPVFSDQAAPQPMI